MFNNKTIGVLRVKTLRQRQDGQPLTDDIFKYIILNENIWISIKISLKHAPQGPSDKKSVLIQVMAWRGTDNTPYVK